MATLANKLLLGTWLGQFPIQARQFTTNGPWYAVQVKSTFPDAFFVRGKAITSNGDFVFANGVVAADVEALTAGANDYGDAAPVTFSTPAGFVEKYALDGAKYYEYVADIENGVVDTNGDGIPDSIARSTNVFTDALTWMQANIGLTLAIAAGVFLLYKSMQPKTRGRKTGLSAIFG